MNPAVLEIPALRGLYQLAVCRLLNVAFPAIIIPDEQVMAAGIMLAARAASRREAEGNYSGEDFTEWGQGHHFFGLLGAWRSTMSRSSVSRFSSSNQRLHISPVALIS